MTKTYNHRKAYVYLNQEQIEHLKQGMKTVGLDPVDALWAVGYAADRRRFWHFMQEGRLPLKLWKYIQTYASDWLLQNNKHE